MSLRTTLILLALVAALAGVLLLRGDRSGGPGGSASSAPPMLLEQQSEGGIARIELSLTTRELFVLEPRDGAWWIVDPFQDRARPAQIDRLMEALFATPKLAEQPKADADVLARVGLEPPRARVTLSGPGGSQSVRIGERDATGAFVRAVVEGDPALYRTGANVSNVLETPRQEWRDDRFATGDSAFVRRLTLERPGEPAVELEKVGTDWLLARPEAFAADDALAGGLANGLLLLRVLSVPATDPAPETLEEVGLGTTATRVAIDFGNRLLELRFGRGKHDGPEAPRYATSSERPHVYLVEGKALALLAARAKEFRARSLVSVTPKTLRRARLVRQGKVVLDLGFVEAARRFEFSEPIAVPLDDARSSQFHSWLLDLSDLAAVDFLDAAELPPDGRAALGLDPPAALLALDRFDQNGLAEHVELSFGAPAGDGTIPVATSKVPQHVYLVPEPKAAKVLDVDPRQFLLRTVLPKDILVIKRIRASAEGRERQMERGKAEGAEFWLDPATGAGAGVDFQQYLAKLPSAEALRFLPRDPEPEDGFDPPAARLEWRQVGGAGPAEEVLLLGARDKNGTVVRARLASLDALGRGVVFELPVWVLDELLPLLR